MTLPQLTAAMLLPLAALVQAYPVSTFDDGTTQGWYAYAGSPDGSEPFGGTLFVASYGNPGRSLSVIDTVTGGGDLYVGAPAAFTGTCRATPP